MTLLSRIRSLLANLFQNDRVEKELGSELRAHFEMMVEEKLAQGMSEEQARRRASIELGGFDQVRERVMEVKMGAAIEQLGQDLRYGLRMMRRNPGFTAVTVLTLALGIGANTAIFSLVDGIVLRPLPYAQPERLVRLTQQYSQRQLNFWPLSHANFAVYRDQSHFFDRLVAYATDGANLTGRSEPERLQVARVTAGFFEALGVAPIAGRGIEAEDDAPDKPLVCVLSYGLWQRQFGGDRAVLGARLVLNEVPAEVVGVMPEGFAFPSSRVELWVPLGLDAQRKHPFFLRAIGRLRPGVSAAQAESETSDLLRHFGHQDAEFAGSSSPIPEHADLKTVVLPLKEVITGDTPSQLYLLLGAVGVVLLIVCANVANLVMARATARSHEIAVRFALGASPRRMFRQLLTENTLLALCGAAGGVLFAWMAVRLFTRYPIQGIPRVSEVSVNGPVLIFTAALALLTGLLFGLVPALRARRLGLRAGLSEGARAGGPASSHRMNNLLVVAQFALSAVLLVGAGLLLKSFRHLLDTDTGMNAEGVLTMHIALPAKKYADAAPMMQFYQSLLDRVRGANGVSSAAIISGLPFTGENDSDGYVAEAHEPPAGNAVPVGQYRLVSPGYFKTLEIPMRSGRDFLDSDRDGSMLVAIVDETLARKYWPEGDAVGKRIRFGWSNDWLTIVGVAGGIRDYDLSEPKQPHFYLPFAQAQQQEMSLVARLGSNPAAAIGAIRAGVREIDPNLPVYAVRMLDEWIGQRVQNQRLTNLLLAGFATCALLLAAVGIYGVVSLGVNRRVQEFGVRLALGAAPQDIFRLVLVKGALLAAMGVGAGGFVAYWLARYLRALLFEVEPGDAATFAFVAMMLAAAALIACSLPALRAAKVDPIVALRYE